jgi:hypothetical protein
MQFYSCILIFLCGEHMYLMVPVVGICRVFIFGFFHIKRIITIRTRRNYIFSLYTVALLSHHFLCMCFCLLQYVLNHLISETGIGSRALNFSVPDHQNGVERYCDRANRTANWHVLLKFDVIITLNFCDFHIWRMQSNKVCKRRVLELNDTGFRSTVQFCLRHATKIRREISFYRSFRVLRKYPAPWFWVLAKAVRKATVGLFSPFVRRSVRTWLPPGKFL